MIVVDTNIIAYLYLPGPEAENAERLLALDSQWIAPLLWRSEFRNILALYLRKEIHDFDKACQIQDKAEQLMAGGEYGIDSLSVLSLARRTGCSVYDCEFASLAHEMGLKLITADKKLLNAFKGLAISPQTFIS